MDKKSLENQRVLKAGCILVDPVSKKIGLIYRENHDDFEFPKGHLEAGETLKECALRETAEETKIDAKIVGEIQPFVLDYTAAQGESCRSYLFVATATGKSDNTSTDSHTLLWLDPSEVEEKLSYANLKEIWRAARPKIEEYYK